MTEEHREIDLARVRTVPVAGRPNKVRSEDFARPPGDDTSFLAFLDSLPQILQARSLLAVIDAMADAARARRPVVCMMGGHIVKTGVGPVLIDLVQRGVITHLASNGSAVIHDYELARWGGTSEDVEAGLADGTFGMAEETGREMNEAITRGAREGWGLGEALGRALEAADTAHPEQSLLLAARRHGSRSPSTPPWAPRSSTSTRPPTARPSATPATGISAGWPRARGRWRAASS
jgi:hypothetical protein